ncbi:MAG: alpha/beta hydrolase [Pseudomonadota bacterium]
MRPCLCLFFALTLSVDAHSVESIPDLDSHYVDVEVGDGSRLRSIITLPKGDNSPRHPILFTQWVSCGSLEYREGSNSRELLAAIARRSGLALIRVERSALNESGPACEQLDYDTELAHYIDAFAQLLEDPRINAERVYVYGSSLGATTAPLVAQALQVQGVEIAGMMVQGGGAVSYYERMLNFERNYLERRPEEVALPDIHSELLLRARFQYEYLVEGRHPDEVAGDSEEMARIRRDILGMETSNQYGRPFAWHQQAAKQNFLAAWAAVDAPVLVIFNAFDQFEGRHGHKLIVESVNRLRPGSGTFIERPNIGHSDNRYANVEDAYAFRDGMPAWEEAAEFMLRWLDDLQLK